MSDPWGHKLIAYVYVPGDLEAAMDVSDALADAALPGDTFMGITVEVVDEKPYGMGETPASEGTDR